MSNITLKITGMSCGACVSHVTKALENVSGVRTASVDLASQTAHIAGEHLIDTALIAAVEEAGYGAEDVTSPLSPSTIPLTSAGCSCCDS